MLSDVTFRAGPSELQRAGCENNIGQTWFKCMTNSLQLRKGTMAAANRSLQMFTCFT